MIAISPMSGQLVLADVPRGGDPAVLNDDRALAGIVERACSVGDATRLQTVTRRFCPHGVTVLAVLAESHVALHSYPEHAGYMVDVFTCGDRADPMAIALHIVESIGGVADVQLIRRGHARCEAHDRGFGRCAVQPT